MVGVGNGAFGRGLLSLYSWFLGGHAKPSEYAVGDVERRVIWVDSDRWPLAGQYLFGTILFNEPQLEEMPSDVVDYVFLHEVGHGQLPSLVRPLFSLLRYLLMLTAVFTLPPLIGLLALAFITSPLPELDPLVAVYLTSVAMVLVPLVTISWLDEGYAEAYTVSQLVGEEYLRRTRVISRRSESGQIKQILHRLIYPPPRLVVWVIEYLSKIRDTSR